MRFKKTARTRELKEAIVASFSLQRGEAAQRLGGFTEADWQSVLWWLDISGMAIYFLDHMQRTGAERVMPSEVEAGLADRLQRNRFRIQTLRTEAQTFADLFQSNNIEYALLKGITLAPESVSDSALRCQTDLDFLVPEENADLAIECIRSMGYRLYARSGITMEFRAGDLGLPDLKKIYSTGSQRALDLHILPEGSSKRGLLARRTIRIFDDTPIATLSPADILMQQAMHLLKHLCSDHSRLSWVLEFSRHVEARRSDRMFWSHVENLAAEELNGPLALSVASWLTNAFFNKEALELPRQGKVDAIPPRVLLWLNLFTHNLLLSDSSGNKLYLLLRGEVPREAKPLKKTHLILFPRCLPARITRPRSGERLAERLTRYAIEADYFFGRMRFHVVEGIRYAIETLRWRRGVVRFGL
jgi:hypothetical protein